MSGEARNLSLRWSLADIAYLVATAATASAFFANHCMFTLVVAVPMVGRAYAKRVLPRGERRRFWTHLTEAVELGAVKLLVVIAGVEIQVKEFSHLLSSTW